ncbi:AarF/UbiB family protein [Dactylosporangium sp. NBC_01737]|uniref:AarF/UbiB family protein n=1 Tax=Dactylosporangium sp. NBC_01737 TaxID=2975959 RepID=UPI002E15BF63|nr:AarF/UbiB family protein [Dactylosporangium sp. NBC_01737]
MLRQILVAGVFHADPHPGNVLLLTDGRLGLLDFGSVGRLDGGVREALQRLLLALDRGDPAGATDALLGVVARPDKVDEELTTLVPVLRRLPRRVDRIASALERGRLGVNVRLFADERDRRHVSALVHQVLLTVLGGVAGIMAVMLLGTPGGPMVTATLSLYALFGYHLLAVAAILALRVLVVIFRTGR